MWLVSYCTTIDLARRAPAREVGVSSELCTHWLSLQRVRHPFSSSSPPPARPPPPRARVYACVYTVRSLVCMCGSLVSREYSNRCRYTIDCSR